MDVCVTFFFFEKSNEGKLKENERGCNPYKQGEKHVYWKHISGTPD